MQFKPGTKTVDFHPMSMMVTSRGVAFEIKPETASQLRRAFKSPCGCWCIKERDAQLVRYETDGSVLMRAAARPRS